MVDELQTFGTPQVTACLRCLRLDGNHVDQRSLVATPEELPQAHHGESVQSAVGVKLLLDLLPAFRGRRRMDRFVEHLHGIPAVLHPAQLLVRQLGHRRWQDLLDAPASLLAWVVIAASGHRQQVDHSRVDRLERTRQIGEAAGQLFDAGPLEGGVVDEHRAGVAAVGDQGVSQWFRRIVAGKIKEGNMAKLPFRRKRVQAELEDDLLKGTCPLPIWHGELHAFKIQEVGGKSVRGQVGGSARFVEKGGSSQGVLLDPVLHRVEHPVGHVAQLHDPLSTELCLLGGGQLRQASHWPLGFGNPSATVTVEPAVERCRTMRANVSFGLGGLVQYGLGIRNPPLDLALASGGFFRQINLLEQPPVIINAGMDPGVIQMSHRHGFELYSGGTGEVRLNGEIIQVVVLDGCGGFYLHHAPDDLAVLVPGQHHVGEGECAVGLETGFKHGLLRGGKQRCAASQGGGKAFCLGINGVTSPGFIVELTCNGTHFVPGLHLGLICPSFHGKGGLVDLQPQAFGTLPVSHQLAFGQGCQRGGAGVFWCR